jgi:hypothetical protein
LNGATERQESALVGFYRFSVWVHKLAIAASADCLVAETCAIFQRKHAWEFLFLPHAVYRIFPQAHPVEQQIAIRKATTQKNSKVARIYFGR